MTPKGVPLENLIRHWEGTLFSDGYLMAPITRVLIEGTIHALTELKERNDSLKRVAVRLERLK